MTFAPMIAWRSGRPPRATDRDAAERSEAAADLADGRGRDADRLIRWMVCIATSVAVALAVQMVEKRQLSHFRVSVAERHGPLRHPDPNSDPLKPWNPLPVPHLLFCLNGAGRRRRRTAGIRDEVPDDRCRPGPRRRLASANPGSATATRTEKYRPQYPPSVPAPEVRRTRARKNHATREPNSPIRRPISRPASEKYISRRRDPIPLTDFHPAPAAQRTELLRRRAGNAGERRRRTGHQRMDRTEQRTAVAPLRRSGTGQRRATTSSATCSRHATRESTGPHGFRRIRPGTLQHHRAGHPRKARRQRSGAEQAKPLYPAGYR